MSVDRIISAESGGDPYARNPRSTATGAGQFIEATWLDMIGRHRPDLITGLGRDEILALRTDPALSRDMTEAYANENKGLLGKAGLPVTDGTAYLAHFAGPQGAMGILRADPSAPAGGILGPSVVKANPFLANMTAGDLVAWANKKMGGGTPAATAPSSVPAPMMAQAPQQPAPQGMVPQGILAPATPQQQAQGVLGGGMSPEQIQELLAPPKPIQHLPIAFNPPRKAGFSLRR